MLKASLWFLAVGLACLALADIEIVTLDPWGELGRLLSGFARPDLRALPAMGEALLNTVTFAFCGLSLAVLLGSGLAFVFEHRVVRLGCAAVRAVHEIFWAFLFLPMVGLNPVCGVLAIAIPYAGVFAKVYAEILQEADRRPMQALPPGSSPVSRFCYGILPTIWPNLKAYTSYRLECALRSSAVLGFIGLPTLGFHLETAFREGLYGEAAALLYVFYLLIASLRYWVRPRLVVLYAVLSAWAVSPEVHLSWINVKRFLTWEILPWPMRREGFQDGSLDIAFPVEQVWSWLDVLVRHQALPGVWNTVLLTQAALAATGLFAVVFLGVACRHVSPAPVRRLVHFGLIVGRTTPEYLLAYVFLQLWGPSMLPALVAILLHNGAILSYLGAGSANVMRLRLDAPRRALDRYAWEVLPRVYGQFLAFLFYRWEVMMRESAILGILGVTTLGFFIDSAIAEDKLDQAVVLIGFTALLNMGIDSISQVVRRRLRLASGASLAVAD